MRAAGAETHGFGAKHPADPRRLVGRGFTPSLLAAAAAALAIVVLVVQLVDPYGVSPIGLDIAGFNTQKPLRFNIDRQIKPYEVWTRRPKTIFMGTSRVYEAFDPSVLEGTGFAPAYNASVPAGELAENVGLLDLFLRLNPTIEYVFFELFFYNFTRSQPAGFVPIEIGDMVARIAPLFFSKDAITASFTTISDNLSADPTPKGQIGPLGQWRPSPRFVAGAAFSKDVYIDSILKTHAGMMEMRVQSSALDALDNLERVAAAHGVKIYYIILPSYPWDDYRLLSLGLWDELRQWHMQVGRRRNVFDFAQYRAETGEPPGSPMVWWHDPIHISGRFGDALLRELPLTGAGGDEVAARLTADNAAHMADRRLQALEEWVARHPSFAVDFEKVKLLDFSGVAWPPVGNPAVAAAQATARREMAEQVEILDPDGSALDDGLLRVAGTAYPLRSRFAGSLETAFDFPAKLRLLGWAADAAANREVRGVVATAGRCIVGFTRPTNLRKDIRAGVAAGADVAGFRLDIEKRRLAPGLPVAVYALMQDGTAARLNSGLSWMTGGSVADYTSAPAAGRTDGTNPADRPASPACAR